LTHRPPLGPGPDPEAAISRAGRPGRPADHYTAERRPNRVAGYTDDTVLCDFMTETRAIAGKRASSNWREMQTRTEQREFPLGLDEIADMIAEEERLADDFIHLTANETVLSPLAQRALASPLTNRYLLEHLDMRRDSPSRLGNLLYRGLDLVNEIERSATHVCRLMFGAEFAEFRCVSGLHAMQTTFAALTHPGDKIMRVSTQDGGHFLTELICRSFGRRSCTYTYSGINELDLAATAETYRRERPTLLYIDAMNYLFPLPLKELREIVGQTPIVFDASHTLGLIAGRQFPNPLSEGADILQANTHKTFFGPQKGIILGNNRALMERIGYFLSNGLVSSQHTASTLALFVALHEMYREGEQYASDVLHNSRHLAAALVAHAIPVMGGDRGFTANHMLLVDARPFGSGILVLEKLLRANISANRLLPFGHVDAIRMGVQEITRRGYDDADLEAIAGWLDRLLNRDEEPERIRPEVIDLARKHSTVRYTGIPASAVGSLATEAGRLAPRGETHAAGHPGYSRTVAAGRPNAKPRWAQIALSPATANLGAKELDEIRQLGRLAGAFEHQIDSSGNISITDASGRLFVTATGAYIKDLRDDDMIYVRSFSNWTLNCAGDGPPSTEAYMHYLIRQETHARYIVHNHYIADEGLERLGVIVIPPKEYGSVELAEAAAEAATQHPVFYVRRHGLVFCATEFRECVALLAKIAEGMMLLE
jgi:fluorothreonine transaldolase